MAKKSIELTIREARNEYGYSKQQLYNLVDERAVKSRKIGWQHLINRKSLERYIAESGRSTRGQSRSEAHRETENRLPATA
jgi:Helix-turn-helix domain